jgi:Spy/CpxP family protein refolding chaperone
VKRGYLSALAAVFVPALLLAQGPPRPGPAWWEMPWWNSPLVRNLNLSETQMKDIRAAVREYRGPLMALRESVQRADNDLEAVLSTAPVDQRKATDAIDRLANARAEMTRTLSQMTVRLRGILTNEQWQELHQRASERGPGRFGKGRGGPGGPPPGSPQGPPPESVKQ